MKINVMDVTTALLYGKLESNDIEMLQRSDFEVNGKICKLKKAIYGL